MSTLEGFFGTLKQEFFYGRDWDGVTRKWFTKMLDEYLVWYRDEKIKKSHDWISLKSRRALMGMAA